jgi:hypothetical protein
MLLNKAILIMVTAVAVLPVVGCQRLDLYGGRADSRRLAFWPKQVVLQPSFTRIMGKSKNDGEQTGKIEVYVQLKDQFGDPVKSLGQFRFELFRYQPAVSDPRGQRFLVGGVQQFDLTVADVNQQYWDSVTLNYRFDLKLPEPVQEIVVQVTFSSEAELRLQDALVVGGRH